MLLAGRSGNLLAGEKALFERCRKQRQHGNETCTADQRGGNHKTQVRIQGRLLNQRNPGPLLLHKNNAAVAGLCPFNRGPPTGTCPSPFPAPSTKPPPPPPVPPLPPP